jgi:ASC-1-like (ASCH) protein
MSPASKRWQVWADIGKGEWEFFGSFATKKGADRKEKAIVKAYKKKVTTRINDMQNPTLFASKLKRRLTKKKGQRGKGPPRLGGKWKDRKRPLGFRAREILQRVRSGKKKLEVRTMLDLAKSRDIDRQTFVNYIQSLGFTGQEAYTFWFSPP